MNADESVSVSSSRWRDASHYAYTQRLTREGWALEFLSRNRSFDALAARLRRTMSITTIGSSMLRTILVSGPCDALRQWGLHFRRSFRPPDCA